MAAKIPDGFKGIDTKSGIRAPASLMADGRPQVSPVWFDSKARSFPREHGQGAGQGQEHAAQQSKWRYQSRIRTTPTAIWPFKASGANYRNRRRHAYRCAR